MTNHTRTKTLLTAQQKAEAVELCLPEGLSCDVVVQHLIYGSTSTLSFNGWLSFRPSFNA